MKKPFIIGMGFLGLLAGAVSGGFVGRAIGRSEAEGLFAKERARAFQAGYDRAKTDINELFVQKGMSYPLGYPVTDVFGRIIEIRDDGFLIEYDASQFTVLDEGMVQKSVVLASGAKLQKMVDAPTDVVAAAEAPADLAPRGGTGALVVPVPDTSSGGPPSAEATAGAGPTPPESASQVALSITLSDIKVGDYVHVKTQGSARTDESLVATEVTVLNVVGIGPGERPKVTDLPFSRSFGRPSGEDVTGAPQQ